MTDDLIIYTPWPLDVVNDAISEFNHQMHDGAGIEELAAGLHGLDFLTRRSDLDDNTQARLDGCITEAQMRIELIGAKEAEERAYAEQLEKARRAVWLLQRQTQAIQNMIDGFRSGGVDVLEYVRERVEARKAMGLL